MDNYDYIEKMDRIGFKLIASVIVFGIFGVISHELGYEITSGIFLSLILLTVIIGTIYANRSNKKQFAKGEKEE